MGIVFDRILEGFDGPFEKLADVITPPPGRVTAAPQGGAYLIGAQVNDAFVAVNRLLQAEPGGALEPRGRSRRAARAIRPARSSCRRTRPPPPFCRRLAADKGLTIEAIDRVPAGDRATVALRPVRIGLWDTYGGSMPSGWTRWLLEQFEFPFEVVFPKSLDAGNLASRFDVLIFVDGAIPDARRRRRRDSRRPRTFRRSSATGSASVSVSRDRARAPQFVEAGGTLLAIGSSTSIGHHLGLPIRNALVERGATGDSTPLPSEKFFVPGSLLEARVDTVAPARLRHAGARQHLLRREPRRSACCRTRRHSG